MNNSDSKKMSWFLYLFIGAVLVGGYLLVQLVRNTAADALDPLRQANDALSTQVSELLHPTPTVIPDPVTIIHEVRALARLETIQYSVEKIITAEVNQGVLGPLFGDRLLFVAHGNVIAGIDLAKLDAQDLWLEAGILRIRLPAAEVLVVTLDNEQSYVYDRDTGLFTHGDPNLETLARQVAEQEILAAALEDGILRTAQLNAELYLEQFIRALGYPEIVFVQDTP